MLFGNVSAGRQVEGSIQDEEEWLFGSLVGGSAGEFPRGQSAKSIVCLVRVIFVIV